MKDIVIRKHLWEYYFLSNEGNIEKKIDGRILRRYKRIQNEWLKLQEDLEGAYHKNT